MVIPDGIVENERAVAVSPRVPCTGVFFKYNCWNTQTFKPGAKCNTALTAANDDTIGLFCVSKRSFFFVSTLEPVFLLAIYIVLCTKNSIFSCLFLMTL